MYLTHAKCLSHTPYAYGIRHTVVVYAWRICLSHRIYAICLSHTPCADHMPITNAICLSHTSIANHIYCLCLSYIRHMPITYMSYAYHTYAICSSHTPYTYHMRHGGESGSALACGVCKSC